VAFVVAHFRGGLLVDIVFPSGGLSCLRSGRSSDRCIFLFFPPRRAK